MRNRKAALEGLARIVEAGGLEELFAGPDEEASFVYDLLVDVARGRGSTYYWEVCRTARRRGVTPEFVIDRAAVLVTSMEERRRTDLYRILGATPLSSPEMLRHRWLEFAKTGHPDVGGDTARFRQVKEAYEILRDPERRAEYERFWVRALGPFERVAPSRGARAAGPGGAGSRRPSATAGWSPWSAVPAPPPLASSASAERRGRERADGAARRRAPVRGARRARSARRAARRRRGRRHRRAPLARRGRAGPGEHDELTTFRAEVDRGIEQLELMRRELATIAGLKRTLARLRAAGGVADEVRGRGRGSRERARIGAGGVERSAVTAPDRADPFPRATSPAPLRSSWRRSNRAAWRGRDRPFTVPGWGCSGGGVAGVECRSGGLVPRGRCR